MKGSLPESRYRGLLRKGDMVMVISGGHGIKRPIKGKTGRILRFSGKGREKVIVEGLNGVTRHVKAKAPGEKSRRMVVEAPIHVSRCMFFAEKFGKPVTLGKMVLADGTRVRAFKNPETGTFEQLPS